MFNLPLKTRENTKGIYSEHELYMVLAIIFVCIVGTIPSFSLSYERPMNYRNYKEYTDEALVNQFFDIDPAKSFALRQAAKGVTMQLGKLIEANVQLVTGLGLRGFFAAKPKADDPLASYGVNIIKGLHHSGLSVYDVAWSHLLPTASASVPNIAEVVSCFSALSNPWCLCLLGKILLIFSVYLSVRPSCGFLPRSRRCPACT